MKGFTKTNFKETVYHTGNLLITHHRLNQNLFDRLINPSQEETFTISTLSADLFTVNVDSIDGYKQATIRIVADKDTPVKPDVPLRPLAKKAMEAIKTEFFKNKHLVFTLESKVDAMGTSSVADEIKAGISDAKTRIRLDPCRLG